MKALIILLRPDGQSIAICRPGAAVIVSTPGADDAVGSAFVVLPPPPPGTNSGPAGAAQADNARIISVMATCPPGRRSDSNDGYLGGSTVMRVSAWRISVLLRPAAT